MIKRHGAQEGRKRHTNGADVQERNKEIEGKMGVKSSEEMGGWLEI